ncbi:S-adenosyl-L-methionine-dependent methyltransferase [Peziza echinospora]|nr:S-adenosyl-L-methionine-dependent methyltransferase [Peziza echinospora]
MAGNSAREVDKDWIVQQTDVDASGSRLAAVNLGYLKDDYAAMLHAPDGGAGSAQSDQQPRRFPLINRGTYTRTTAIDQLVVEFLSSTPVGVPKQIISLGAGSDTRFWRFKVHSGPRYSNVIYHELDFEAVARKKATQVNRFELLQKHFTVDVNSEGLWPKHGKPFTVDAQAGRITSQDYYLHPIDIRTLKPNLPVSPLPDTINTTLPTLIISECCLIYLSPTEADAILSLFISTFTKSPLGIVLYEPIGGEDAFGKVMIQNLATRGIVLKTLKKYSTLERQKERLRCQGFTGGQQAADVDWIFDNWISEEEKRRLSGLEMLDEVEEWQLLAKHYCVAWGWRDGETNDEGAWLGWKNMKTQGA